MNPLPGELSFADAWQSNSGASLDEQYKALKAALPADLRTPARPPKATGKAARAARPMTGGERTMALALGRCRFSPGTFAKRFALLTSERAARPDAQITEPGADCLRRLVIHYRRQLPASVVALAVDHYPQEHP